jgi:phage gp45-like
VIRGIIQSVDEGVIKRFTASGRPDETIADRESFQHYGYTSRPLSGAEGIIINNGGAFVMIAEDDRRYRIGIEAGEVSIYTDEGDHIRFKRDKEIYIKSGNKLTAEIASETEITCPVVNVHSTTVTVNASAQLQVNSPLINLATDRNQLRRLIDERFRELFNMHTHSGCGGDQNSGTPNQTLEYVNCATDIVRAK